MTVRYRSAFWRRKYCPGYASSRRIIVARARPAIPAIATNPKLLLLDEVMAGLNSTELQQMLLLLRELNARGIAILLIEHIMAAVMNISKKVIVIHHGEKIAEGLPSEVSTNKLVIEAYFGEE